MDITVSVGDVDLNTEIERGYDGEKRTLADLVAEKFVEHAVRTGDYSGMIGDRVRAIRDEAIREAVAPVVAEAVSAPTQRTNQWGEATGETTSLRELIVAEARSQLTKASDPYNRNQTMVQKLIADEVNRALSRELMETVGAEKEKVVAAVRAKAAELIADAVKQGIGR